MQGAYDWHRLVRDFESGILGTQRLKDIREELREMGGYNATDLTEDQYEYFTNVAKALPHLVEVFIRKDRDVVSIYEIAEALPASISEETIGDGVDVYVACLLHGTEDQIHKAMTYRYYSSGEDPTLFVIREAATRVTPQQLRTAACATVRVIPHILSSYLLEDEISWNVAERLAEYSDLDDIERQLIDSESDNKGHRSLRRLSVLRECATK